MKRMKTVVLMLFAVVACACLSGCVPPRSGAAFSPDSGSMAYVDKERNGIVLQNFTTGKAVSVYKAAEKNMIQGLYWDAKKNMIYFIEEISGGCEKEGAQNKIALKTIEPATKKVSVAFTETIPGVCVKDGQRSEAFQEGIIMRLFSTNFDVNTMSFESGGITFPQTAKTASPYALVRKADPEERILNPTISPDGKYIAYLSLLEDESAKASGVRAGDIMTKLLRVADGNVTTIQSIRKSSKDKNEGVNMMFYIGSQRWSHDGATLYYLAMEGAGAVLMKYDVGAAKSEKVMPDNIYLFTTFPKDDRILVFHDRDGKKLATILRGDGSTESTFPALAPDKESGSPAVSPDGAKAAALVPFDSQESMFPGFLPVVYDLKNRKDKILVFHPEDNMYAGDIYARQGRYEDALAYYKKGGEKAAVRTYAAYLHLKRPAEAEAIYKTLAAKATGGDGPRFKIAEELSNINEVELAEAEYLKAPAAKKGRALFAIGEMYRRAEKNDAAAKFYKQAIAEYTKMTCYEENYDLDKCDDTSGSRYAPYKYAQSLAAAGRDAEALAQYELVLEKFPNTVDSFSWNAFVEISDLYDKIGNCGKALEMLTKGAEKKKADLKFFDKDSDDDLVAVLAKESKMKGKCGK